MLEREIDELRRKPPAAPRRAHPPSTPPTPKPIPVGPIDELSTRGPAISRFAVALAFCFALATLFLVSWVLRGG